MRQKCFVIFRMVLSFGTQQSQGMWQECSLLATWSSRCRVEEWLKYLVGRRYSCKNTSYLQLFKGSCCCNGWCCNIDLTNTKRCTSWWKNRQDKTRFIQLKETIKTGYPYYLVIIRVLMGLCEAGTFPCITSMLARWAPEQERATMSTFIMAGSQVGDSLLH